MDFSYKHWIEALRNGNITRLNEITAQDQEMWQYESLQIHLKETHLPRADMNSAQIAAWRGQIAVLRWLWARNQGFSDYDIFGNLPSCLQWCIRGFQEQNASLSPAARQRYLLSASWLLTQLEWTPETIQSVGEICGNFAAYIYQSPLNDSETSDLKKSLLIMRTRVCRKAGSAVALAIATNLLGLSPFWLIVENLPEQERRNATKSAADQALLRHPNPSVAKFVASMREQDREQWEEYLRAEGLQTENLSAVYALLGKQTEQNVPMPARYLFWNLALANAILAEAKQYTGNQFRLPYTPLFLENAWNALFPSLADGTAEQDFLQTVSIAYRQAGYQGRIGGLDRFLQTYGDIPCGLAFCITSIIAADRMQHDESVNANNYYARLGEALGYGLQVPQGLQSGPQRDQLRDLWHCIREWLRPIRILHLPVAQGNKDLICAIPQSHVSLRDEDISRLPQFFIARRYRPQTILDPAALAEPLQRWAELHLTHQGWAALNDSERREAVLSQVADELSRWDGGEGERVTRAGKTVRLRGQLDYQLTFSRRAGYALQLCAARPDGFPKYFDTASGLTLESDGLTKYYPVSVPAAMSDAILRGVNIHCGDYSLRGERQSLIVFVPGEETTNWVAAPALPLGSPCHVLSHVSVQEEVTKYLKQVCEIGFEAYGREILPGWTLWTNALAARTDVNAPMPALSVETQVAISFSGGLRLGRAQQWLTVAPPRICVSGDYGHVTINGEPVIPDTDGLFSLNGRAGRLEVMAGGLVTVIELVVPSRHGRLCTCEALQTMSDFLYPLAKGEWTLLGAEPGQIKTYRLSQSSVVTVNFSPKWIFDETKPLYVYAATDDLNSIPAKGTEHSAQWYAKLETLRKKQRAGRYCSASQRQVEQRWQAFRGQYTAPSLPSAPIATARPPTNNTGSQHSHKKKNGKKIR